MGTRFHFNMPEGELPADAHPHLKRIKTELAELPEGQSRGSIELTAIHGEQTAVRSLGQGYSLWCDSPLLVIPEWITRLGVDITKIEFSDASLPFVESLAPYLGKYAPQTEEDHFRGCAAEVDLVARNGFVHVAIQLTARPNEEGYLPDIEGVYSAIRTRKIKPYSWLQAKPRQA